MVVLGVDGDDGVAVDVEERRRIPERRQVQAAAGPASKLNLSSVKSDILSPKKRGIPLQKMNWLK